MAVMFSPPGANREPAALLRWVVNEMDNECDVPALGRSECERGRDFRRSIPAAGGEQGKPGQRGEDCGPGFRYGSDGEIIDNSKMGQLKNGRQRINHCQGSIAP